MDSKGHSGGNVSFAAALRRVQALRAPRTQSVKRGVTKSVTSGGAAYAVIGVTLRPGQSPVLSFLYLHRVRPARNLLAAHDNIPIAPSDVLDYHYLLVCNEDRLKQFVESGKLKL